MNNEQNLPTMPDWTTAPEWAMFCAIDKSGFAAWYECEPVPGVFCWWPNIYDSTYLSIGKIERGNYTNWKNSLQKRPENV